MTNYQNGAAFERRTSVYLTDEGFFVVRSAGSRSLVDLVAVKPLQVLFVQAKRDGRLDPDEWDALFAAAAHAGAVPVLAAAGPRGRGIVLTRLLGTKRRGARTQPCEPFIPDQLASGGAA